MRVLVACEYSGRVRDAFIRAGHDAMSCDLLPTDVPGPHYEGDVRDILDGLEIKDSYRGGIPFCDLSAYDQELANQGILENDIAKWDLLIAHPPCTYMTNSGVSWLHKDPDRWALLDEAAVFFNALLNAPIPQICIENPIMHKYAKERIGNVQQSQVIQPWMFGHMEQKATCLWLKGLPLLRPTNNVKEEMKKLPKNERERTHYLPPSADRWKIRSTTYQGIADAMAAQWGNL